MKEHYTSYQVAYLVTKGKWRHTITTPSRLHIQTIRNPHKITSRWLQNVFIFTATLGITYLTADIVLGSLHLWPHML